jgi:hypothetical protein
VLGVLREALRCPGVDRVFLVVNGSRDRTADYARWAAASDPRITVREEPEPLGHDVGRSVAAEWALAVPGTGDLGPDGPERLPGPSRPRSRRPGGRATRPLAQGGGDRRSGRALRSACGPRLGRHERSRGEGGPYGGRHHAQPSLQGPPAGPSPRGDGRAPPRRPYRGRRRAHRPAGSARGVSGPRAAEARTAPSGSLSFFSGEEQVVGTCSGRETLVFSLHGRWTR